MKGIELCKRYYEAFGAPMLENFPDVADKIAVGVFGSGSECYGYDDETSKDHDFEPSFTIILPSENEVDRRTQFLLERAYAKLPDEFLGYKRAKINPVGGSRRGVKRAEEFWVEKVGKKDGLISGDEWFSIPESYLAEATNGEIFRDPSGTFSATREYLSSYPENVRLKKLAGNLLLASQAGQYNYVRSIARGDVGAAQLSVSEFVDKSINCAFLLAKKYRPYYKWTFRALRELPVLSGIGDDAYFLLTSPNDKKTALKKTETIEKICSRLAEEVCLQKLSEKIETDLERLAYSVNEKISDERLRNENVLYGV